jgi:hypothetical protein
MRPLIFGGVLAVAALVAGCQSARDFTTPDASWKSHIGQLRYESGERVIVGEVVVTRRGFEEFQLEFIEGGSPRLLKLWISGEKARAEGLLARGSWQGPIYKAPQQLRHWMKLPAIFAAADAGQKQWMAVPASGASAAMIAEGGAIQQIRVLTLSPDEDLVFRFQP